MKTLIYGSCVTRDAFELAPKSAYEIDYYARSSFTSAFDSLDIDSNLSINVEAIESPFQKKIVTCDLNRILSKTLLVSDYDLIIIDLIDERFDVYKSNNGSIITLSNEFYKTGFRPSLNQGEIIKSGSDHFLCLWAVAWSNFISIIKQRNLINRLLINRVYWSNKTENLQKYIDFDEYLIEKNNLFLDKLYNIIANDISFNQFITYDMSLLRGSENHKWGISPFHFIDEF